MKSIRNSFICFLTSSTVTILLIIPFILMSCNTQSKQETYEVKVDDTTIGGKLSQYFSVEDKTYKYKLGTMIDNITVELKCIEPLPENMKAYINVDVLDEEGNVIASGKPNKWSFNDYNKLRQATPGQIVTINIDNHENVTDGKPAKIRLSSVVEDDREEQASAVEDSDESCKDDNKDTEESMKVDKLLSQVEECAGEFETLYTRYRNGDNTVANEFNSWAIKLKSLEQELEKIEGSLTDEQKSRLEKALWRINDIQQ